MRLSLLPERFAVCRLPETARVEVSERARLFSVTRTAGELSLVCEERHVPGDAEVEGDWRAFVVSGPLAFTLTGVISSLTAPLAEAGVPVFVLSTFETDYLLVRGTDLPHAVETLRTAGYAVASEAE
ncbi:hypothetical protein RradSPS_2295 [Rubrobacter radiotolerans]|uniref:Uncharacterized protein n=1 Tax=Rubrobacter radiotolerans TaxID=42256 RepID=A0A023X5J7_RUBRA|nr:hypothetical protein RradSPS_2295 [Rubrobacter radiotolerans]SMC07202.1 hypothetical protein SAMN00767673_2298 [Rubrobacter radiotolerans DSM 5868]